MWPWDSMKSLVMKSATDRLSTATLLTVSGWRRCCDYYDAIQSVHFGSGKIWEEPLEGIEEDKFITHTAAYYYDIFAEQTPEIHMWVTDYCHIMQNHEQILDFLRGAAFTPYQSRLDEEEMQVFARGSTCPHKRGIPNPEKRDGAVSHSEDYF